MKLSPKPVTAAAPTNPDPLLVQSFVDHVDWQQIRGWARDPATPEESLWLEIIVDDADPVSFLANLQRPDLVEAGFSHGRFGFHLRFPQPLDPALAHRVHIRQKSNGARLSNSPQLLARAPSASAEIRAGFEAIVTAEIEAVLQDRDAAPTVSFLLQQVDRLLQAQADAASGADALHRFRVRWSDHLQGPRAQPAPPDLRPWALVIDADLPDTPAALQLVLALQAGGYRVAVLATPMLSTTGGLALDMQARDVSVLGMPAYYTAEDALRRHRGQFRAVVLRGRAGAAYAVLCRQHQPQARLLACLSQAPGEADPATALAATLLCDAVAAESDAAAMQLARQLPGRKVAVLPVDAEIDGVSQVLTDCGIINSK